jgi:hypothetical protein
MEYEQHRGGIVQSVVSVSRRQGFDMIWYMIYLLTAIVVTPGGSSNVNIYT